MTPHPLQPLYDQIPAVPCSGQCGRNRQNTCCGPIGCTKVEAELLEAFNGSTCKWFPRPDGSVIMNLTQQRCPHLGLSGRCEAYAVRPLICRLWGAVEDLRCPWGCKPDRYLTRLEARRLLAEARRLTTQKPAPRQEHSAIHQVAR